MVEGEGEGPAASVFVPIYIGRRLRSDAKTRVIRPLLCMEGGISDGASTACPMSRLIRWIRNRVTSVTNRPGDACNAPRAPRLGVSNAQEVRKD